MDEQVPSNFREVVKYPSLGFEHLRRVLDADPLRSVFYFALRSQYANATRGMSCFGNYYEFGVGWGGSLAKYIRALKAFSRTIPREDARFSIVLFDTFDGMPAKVDARDDNPTWRKGLWSHSLEEIKNIIRKEGLDPDSKNIIFVKGEFNTTLTDKLRSSLSKIPPSIINLDVDYYSSTITSLNWLRPFLPSGAILYFDDLWGFHGNPFSGQFAAIHEFNKSEDGWLIPFPEVGTLTTADRIYKYARREFEYATGLLKTRMKQE